ncbi:MAG: hypothetical protein DIZ80_08165 [endosymbiont of Galathealinum brachiosum]|uniref:Peptidase C14 caspase domain-containing protein n=1 Tax=endosymbiont of Galathealinum brachiosum TaxID=2200906 RepID=A0A370DIH9_9GAMM|nr:MAG: hypothetical protein DIZ80_08165 [endosymbiont of Galathealinum brachiosum]
MFSNSKYGKCKLGNQWSLLLCSISLMFLSLSVSAKNLEKNTDKKITGNRYALLVSVSKYPNLKKHMQLVGPEHDAELVHASLIENGFSQNNITVLADADDIEGAITPTLSAITGGFDQLADKVSTGDFVYIHFAGHGSQQPAKSNAGLDAEADGMDEIFLPADIENWSYEIGAVKNALVDDVVGEKIAAIRDKGAFVWIVFDSCHSGTMTRAINIEEKDRRISPMDLGIPVSEIDKAEKQVVKTRGAPKSELPLDNVIANDGDKRGGLVAFYAAQTTETTPEMRLPRGHIDRQTHGLFTYILMSVIAQNQGITYRQASQEILNRYSAFNRNSPTPLFEGSDLDAVVFGSESVSEVKQWRLKKESKKLTLTAGTLHNVNENSILAVYPGPTSKDEEVLGYVNVNKSGVLKSSVVAIEHNGKKALSRKDIPAGAYLRMAVPAISMKLTVALPDEPGKALKTVLDEFKNDKNTGLQLNWVTEKEDADLRIYQYRDRVFMLLPSALFDKSHVLDTPSISIEDKDFKSQLLVNLSRVARVTNLMRLSTQLGKVKQGAGQVELRVTVSHRKSDETEIFDSSTMPTLRTGDKVALEITNTFKVPVDVTLLFVSSDYGIETVYPYEANEINRIEAGKALVVPGFSIDASSSRGLERLIMIAVQAEPSSPSSDFTFLTQSALERTRGTVSPLHGLFEQAGFGKNNTRGISRDPADNLQRGTMTVYSWVTAH